MALMLTRPVAFHQILAVSYIGDLGDDVASDFTLDADAPLTLPRRTAEPWIYPAGIGESAHPQSGSGLITRGKQRRDAGIEVGIRGNGGGGNSGR